MSIRADVSALQGLRTNVAIIPLEFIDRPAPPGATSDRTISSGASIWSRRRRCGKASLRCAKGCSFCLSLPLDYPGGNVLNPRRYPPQLRPTIRNGKPNMDYALRYDDPALTDVVCDDQVLLTLQYSTQWDSLAHVGQMFDMDGDGVPEGLL